MTVVIGGSRSITDLELGMAILDTAISKWPGEVLEIDEVISGCAPGFDSIVLMKPWACEVRKMPADWRVFGNSAGILRNLAMGRRMDALISVWDGKSPGTRHMISVAKHADKPYLVVEFQGDREVKDAS